MATYITSTNNDFTSFSSSIFHTNGSSPNASSSAWYLDNSVALHITLDQNVLTHQTNYQGQDQLTVGNGLGLKINYVGFTYLKSFSFPLKLKNILHVLDITCNLLSIK